MAAQPDDKGTHQPGAKHLNSCWWKGGDEHEPRRSRQPCKPVQSEQLRILA